MSHSPILTTTAKILALIAALIFAPLSQAEESSATVNAVIESVMLSKQMLKVSHEAVPAWGWMKMKMKFPVTEGVDLNALEKGQSVELTLQKDADGKVTITSVK